MQKTTLRTIVGLATLFLICDFIWMSQYFLDLYRQRKWFQENAVKSRFSIPTDCAASTKEDVSITLLNNEVLARDSCTRHHFLSEHILERSLLFGTPPSPKKYLLIGIPTISRKKESYLHQTLKSLIKNMNAEENSRVAIVVLFADEHRDLRHKRAKKTYLKFSESISSGLLVLAQTFPELYPKVNITRRTFRDSSERIRWRSKQVLDWAFLLTYSQNLSEYFLILEDDVITIPGFMSSIQDFVQEKEGSDWVSLTFSSLIIIGRLLKSADLGKLSEFLLLFHREKPVDLLISQFVDLLVPDFEIVTRRIPGMFQHIGLYSSLDGKIQKLKDDTFQGESTGGFPFENNTVDRFYNNNI